MDPAVWRLIVRHQTGEASAAEEAVLRQWARTPEHARLLEEIEAVWEATGGDDADWDVDAAWTRVAARLDDDASPPVRLRVLSGAAESMGSGTTDLVKHRVGVSRRGRFMVAGVAIAASLALFFLPDRTPESPGTLEFSTAIAESRTIGLGDGTLVRLGPASRLVVNDERQVELIGVAFFAVERNPSVPFEITLPAGEVRVLGTRFEVEATANDARVAVLDGRVEVHGASEIVELGSGEATTVVRGGEPERPNPIVPGEVAAWMGRTLAFQRTSMRAAALEMESMYGVQVRVAPALNERTVTGMFTDEPLDRLVPALCRAIMASCTVTDNLVIVEVQQ